MNQQTPCKKCGKGENPGYYYFFIHNAWGKCWRCNGSGWEPTLADRAAAKARLDLFRAARDEFDGALIRLDARNIRVKTRSVLDLSLQEVLEEAWSILERDEPHRFEKMLKSLAAGRGEAVARHLFTYYREWQAKGA